MGTSWLSSRVQWALGNHFDSFFQSNTILHDVSNKSEFDESMCVPDFRYSIVSIDHWSDYIWRFPLCAALVPFSAQATKTFLCYASNYLIFDLSTLIHVSMCRVHAANRCVDAASHPNNPGHHRPYSVDSGSVLPIYHIIHLPNIAHAQVNDPATYHVARGSA